MKNLFKVMFLAIFSLAIFSCTVPEAGISTTSNSETSKGTQLSTPANLKIEFDSTSDTIKLSWDHVLLAEKYLVFRAIGSENSPWIQIGDTTENGATPTNYDDLDINRNSTYYYRVMALSYNYENTNLDYKVGNDEVTDYRVGSSDRFIESAYSEVVSVVTSGVTVIDQFTAPVNVRYVRTAEGGIFVKWNEDYLVKAKGGTFTVRLEDSTGTANVGTATIEGLNTFEYSETNANTNYWLNITNIPSGTFRVGVYAKTTGSIASSAITYATDAVTQYAAIATAPNASATDGLFNNKVLVSWNKVDGANAYYVYRSNATTGLYDQIAAVTNVASYNDVYGNVYYEDTTVAENTKYTYKVYAANTVTARVSTFGTATVLVGRAQTDNSNFSLTRIQIGTVGANQVRMSFNKITDAASYEVYRSYNGADSNYVLTTAVQAPPTSPSLVYTFTDTVVAADYPTVTSVSNTIVNHSFTYRVLAKDTNGMVIVVSATSVASYVDLAIPTVSVDKTTNPGRVSWTGVTLSATGSFTIRRLTDVEYNALGVMNNDFATAGALVTTTAFDATSFDDPAWAGLANGTYHYIVKATDGNSVSYGVRAVTKP
ncbi:MAG: hypothetical protein A2015_04950 [Spirochaetes bacterium GWF1_31_7]|nr:MAG: hypothetical protein A2Y30_05320 [Spirochaetes bacterium GWE1_32_154]OHD48812.1 MAG: hypothetical protein A2Y29_03300 [Spirochaetes bacterium GWE2_31_10]OHD52874.1 MAG: hypothetical protein A2015_04950 [Spirochaetes bacterium GWF1_31_7]OHD82065.1 MAG: hypothetical protein A2355_16325 [Spirochaetes bacterium RIFOXYB1_FULL_32_8]HBD94672.1 hypothetical protein [Spirochaetia bacterium]